MADNTQKKNTKQYYKNVPGFRVASGFPITKGDLKGKTIDYSMVTDEGQGIAFYKDGTQKLVVNDCSYETVGLRTKKGSLAKNIACKYGDMLIDVQDGDLTIKARNVRFEVGDEMTVDVTGQLYVRSPITNLEGNTANILCVGKLSMGGNFVDLSAGVEISMGTQTDKKQGGFLGMILSFADRFKDFL
jgi:hypothetical protein|tara:strand:+ start:243 stop:806 length:564 start_codon:yes stop_codon:yes gene_type:complete